MPPNSNNNEQHYLMKRLFFSFAILCTTLFGLRAQDAVTTAQTPALNPQNTYFNPAFKHVDVGLTLGTTGIGLEAAAPLTDFMDVRAGFTWMPRMEVTMNFAIQVYDKDGNPSPTRFNRMAEMMQQVTGYKVDSQVDMLGKPSFDNFKFLLDFKPFRDKRWHITAGFYLGGRNIARAYNTTEDMPSLFAVGMFNHIRDIYMNDEPWYYYQNEPVYIDPQIGQLLDQMGDMGIQVGKYTHDVLYTENEYYTTFTVDDDGNIHDVGDLKHAVGDVKYPAGSPYLMKPDEESMAKARIRVNAFRPYLGFGYGGRLTKRDDRFRIHFECGAMFWGGTPAIITHDGTNLSKDVTDIEDKVGDYVNFFSSFKVFPVLSVRLTRRF